MINAYIVDADFAAKNQRKQVNENVIEFNQTKDGRWFVNVEAAAILPNENWASFEIVELDNEDML